MTSELFTFKGRKHSEETKRKIGDKHRGKKISQEAIQKVKKALTGRKIPEERKEVIRIKMLGRKFSEETLIKMRNAKLGKKFSEQHRSKMSISAKKKIFSEEHKRNISLSHQGEKNSNWKGGITTINSKIRCSMEYKLWRKAVFERDRWTCVWCLDKGSSGHKVVIHADHIKPFSLFPELRFAIDNGRTLCATCHKKTDTWGRKVFNFKN